MQEDPGAIEGPEPLGPESLDSLIELLDSVFRPGGDRSMRIDYPFLLRPDNFHNLLICRAGQRVVTHVGILPTVLSCFGHPVRVGMVGAVATHPDYRGRGLATRTLLEAFARWRHQGGQMLMISGGRGLYLRNGARPVGSLLPYLLELSALRADRVQVAPCGPDDAPALSRLHRLKPLRFIRPLEEWRLNIEAQICSNMPSDYWLVRRNNAPSAYFALPKKPQDGQPACGLREWGGRPADIVPALAALAPRRGFRHVLWNLHPHEAHIGVELEALGARRKDCEPARVMVRIVDFEGLMGALGGYVSEVLGRRVARRLRFYNPGGETFCARLGRQELRVQGYGALAELLFRSAIAAPEASLEQGPLREALEALLPLPVAQYDMTYA